MPQHDHTGLTTKRERDCAQVYRWGSKCQKTSAGCMLHGSLDKRIYQHMEIHVVHYVYSLQRNLKGKFPQTTMWIGWVESNFTNPAVKVWADLDNPFKRSDYAKLCMSPSLDGTLPEYVISQEDNSPLTLYIDFYHFLFFLDISSPFDQVHS